MKLHRLERRQYLPIPIVEAWAFFANPGNLAQITPPSLDFVVTSVLPEKMHAGLIITYRIRPFLAIPSSWVTEITHCEAPSYFVDEQRFGPYRFWHHQHFFRPVSAGTEMQDIVHYALPGAFAGRLLNRLVVEKRLTEIFDFRQRTLEQLFGAPFPPQQRLPYE
jgi:ligand-binding SRPBCC domain-containing protein